MTQYPLISLRQSEGGPAPAPGGGDIWSSIQGFFQGIGSGIGGESIFDK